MIDDLLEFVVASVILVTGVGIVSVLWGADPEFATSLISGVTKLGVYVLVMGILVAIPLSFFR
ncbi:hypothetical protein [Halorussus amylolyticus]|uniref:hypothetical protein n=1 Tax=Halorussus amylolyticus TaxID=1126242 RepID=UPI00104B21BD|nr:hypothetical protein [Halorussus amylolyticus]